jgi:hypothetical protein
MSADNKKYYSALGVTPSASASEIKSAYRRLAKLHHPDHSASSNDFEIKRINEAYSVLGNGENKAKYDADCAEPELVASSAESRIEPIRCGRCQKVAAQPRYIIFWHVFSFVLGTSRTPVQGFFCASCAKIESLKSTIITAALGWWGVPWGPIWTVGCGFRNALGGEQDQNRNDAIAWHNVVAFIQMRQIAIAYGVAERLLNSRTKEIREAAGDFTALCRSQGFQPVTVLKDSWGPVRNQIPLRLGILALFPAMLGAWILFSGATTGQVKQTTYETPSAQPDDWPGTPVGAEPETIPETLSPVAAPIEVTPPCSHPPSNGSVLSGRSKLVKDGHELKIDNGTSGDAIVKIRNRASNALYASFFIEKGNAATLSGIADGEYSVQYAIGTSLAQDCKSFSGSFNASTFPQTEPFRARYVNDYRGEGYIYSSLSYTLYSVPGGNVRPTSISLDSFNSP